MTRRVRFAIVLAAAWAATGCHGFLESAFELTFGPGDIERVVFEVHFPSVDDLSDFTGDDVGDLPGFPSTLEQGTLAHLQGALVVQGACRQDLTVEEEGDDERVADERTFTLTTCTGEPRCDDVCPTEFRGLTMHARIPLELIDEVKAAELRDQLAEVSADSIVQVRFQAHELTFYQIEGGQEEDVTDAYDEIVLTLSDDLGNEVRLNEPGHFPEVSPDAPQRFDVEGESELMRRTKELLLDAQPVRLVIGLALRIDQPELYRLRIGDAGVRLDVQPEFVISALQAAQSKL